MEMRHVVMFLSLLVFGVGCMKRMSGATDASHRDRLNASPDAKKKASPDLDIEGHPDILSAPTPDTQRNHTPSVVPTPQPDGPWATLDLAPPDVPLDKSISNPPNGPADSPVPLARPGLHSDIDYGLVDGVRLLLDAHVPDGQGPFPVVIMVHGGGWASGDKAEDVKPILGPLTGRFTWFSVNYRLVPKYRWPACLEDVQASIRWIKANASRYKGDPNRIAIAGYSVGGHIGPLAANLAIDGTAVQAVIGVAPNIDLVKDSELRGGLSPSLQKLMNLPVTLTESTRQILAKASPISYIKPGQAPVLLLCGDADKTVPLVMCQGYLAELKKQQVPGEIYVVKGGTHTISAWAALDPNYQQILVDWLHKTLP